MAFDVWSVPARLTKAAAADMNSMQLEQVREHLARRSPDVDFNAVEAAIYTGRSERTIKRAIDAGVGPRRQKNPDASGKSAVNRHIRYRKSDLDLWQASLYEFAPSFSGRFDSFDSLTQDQPWLVAQGRVFCHLAHAGDAAQILEILEEELVVFCRLDEVLQLRWASVPIRSLYQDAFFRILEHVRSGISAATDRDRLDADIVKTALIGSRNPL